MIDSGSSDSQLVSVYRLGRSSAEIHRRLDQRADRTNRIQRTVEPREAGYATANKRLNFAGFLGLVTTIAVNLIRPLAPGKAFKGLTDGSFRLHLQDRVEAGENAQPGRLHRDNLHGS